MSSSYILGISAFYHDSAACLVQGGTIVAAAQEERFSRKKHDSAFPSAAVQYCLASRSLHLRDVRYVVFYDKPLVKFLRLLETYLAFAPKGLSSFLTAMPIWLKEKLFLRKVLKEELLAADPASSKDDLPPLLFSEHHESHAASAFYPSPFERAAVLCVDGVGEWATTSAWMGEGNELTPLWDISFPHSIGLIYSAFTSYTGFKVNSGEYKVMGLAPYGEPTYVDLIYDHLLDLKPDGTFRLNMEYFDYCTGLTMTNEKFDHLFGGPPRAPEGQITQKEMNLARSIQEVTEEVMCRLGRTLHAETGANHLCMAGGVALNCVGNGRLLREGPFERIWIQPAAGDSGGSLGAALAAWHQYDGQPRRPHAREDGMAGAYLGPAYSNDEIELFLRGAGAAYERVPGGDLFDRVATELADGKVVGWFQGRMEFGPRALGNRSILGDARSASMQSTMNLKIKFRESFRPFAPSVLGEQVSNYFELDSESPYMLLVAQVRKDRRIPYSSSGWGIELLKVPKSDIPAVTHVDYSARVQTVHEGTNSRYHALLKAFEAKTGCAVLVNTSFNVRGEPIVCTPKDAYLCFMRTEMDVLVMEDYVLHKASQPPLQDEVDWRSEFALD